MSGRITLEAGAVAKYRKASIDPARFDDWPDSWGEPGCDPDPMTVGEIVEVYENADAQGIAWAKDGLSLRAVFSNDSDCWLTYRSHLAAAVRAAADFGGTGDVAITGYLDGGPDDVFRILARADGTSEVDVLTARKAKPVAERVIADVQPLIEAMLARFKKPAAPIDKDIAPIHARVIAALRALPSDDVVAATASTIRRTFSSATECIAALERNLGLPGPAGGAIAALRILAHASPERAAEPAKAYVDAKGRGKAIAAVRAAAKAFLRPVGDPKQAAAAIAALKKAVPKQPHFMLLTKLPRDPLVTKLRASKSADVHRAAVDALTALTSGKKLERLKTADHVYAYALTLVVEPMASDEELDELFRVWTDAPGFMLLDSNRIYQHGERGKKFLARLFGRRTKNDYSRREQPLAARALLETDDAAAADAVEKIAKKKRADEMDEWCVSSMFQLLRDKPSSRRWADVLVAAAASPSFGAEAIKTLAMWKHPRAAKLAVEAYGKSLGMSEMCELVEMAPDKSVKGALEKILAKLAKNERRDRNRLEQCIASLD
jgi:hypothetical protein